MVNPDWVPVVNFQAISYFLCNLVLHLFIAIFVATT